MALQRSVNRCRDLLMQERERRAVTEAQLAVERERRATVEKELRSERERHAKEATSQEDKPTSKHPRGKIPPFGDNSGRTGEILSLLTILGLTVYGLAWICYVRFYQSFDVSPGEAGLNYATMLSHAAVTVAIILVALLLMLSVAATFTSFEEYVPADRPLLVRLLMLYGLALGAVVAVVIYNLILRPIFSMGESLQELIVLPSPIDALVDLVIILLASLSIPLLFGGAYWIHDTYPQIGKLLKRFGQPSYRMISSWFLARRLIIPMLASLAILGGMISVPYILGSRFANEVYQGDVDKMGNNFLFEWFFDIQVIEVDVTWLQGQPSNMPRRPNFLYLGHSDQVTVLYESSEHRIYRAPSDSISVRTKD